MACKPEVVILLAYINLFGFTRTISEYKEKRKLQWFAALAFLGVFFLVGGLAIFEMIRASDILVQTEELKLEIEAIELNITDAKNRKKELIMQLRDVKVKILKVTCTRLDFSFYSDGMYCITRDLALKTQKDAEIYCQQIGGDGLFKLDTKAKLEMMSNDFPFDGLVDKRTEDAYWIDGKIQNGEWIYSNGTKIPDDLKYDKTLTDPCFVVKKDHQFKFWNANCTSENYAICEKKLTYVPSEFELEEL